MGQEEPGVDHVKLFAGLPSGDISSLEGDVRETMLRSFPSRDIQLDLVKIHPNGPTARPHRARKFESDVTSSASNVEAFRSRCYADLRQQRAGGPGHHFRKKAQPFTTFHSTSDDICFVLLRI
jgi:hypothetical protein